VVDRLRVPTDRERSQETRMEGAEVARMWAVRAQSIDNFEPKMEGTVVSIRRWKEY